MKLLKIKGQHYLPELEHYVDVHCFFNVCEYFEGAIVTVNAKNAIDELTIKELKSTQYLLEKIEIEGIKDLFMLKLYRVSLQKYTVITELQKIFYVTE